MTRHHRSAARSSGRSAGHTLGGALAAAAVSMLITAGCTFATEGDAGSDDSAVTDTIVGGEGSDSILPGSETADTAEGSDPSAVSVADVLGPAIDYVDNSFAALEPEKEVDPAGYCRNAASTLRDEQATVATPDDSAPQDVIDAVAKWTEQTALLATTLDDCAASADATAFIASADWGKAWALFNACVDGLREQL